MSKKFSIPSPLNTTQKNPSLKRLLLYALLSILCLIYFYPYSTQYLQAQYLVHRLRTANFDFCACNLSGHCEEADALIEIGKPSVNPLINMLKKDKDDRLRRESLLVLAEIYRKTSDDRILESLIEALRDKNVDIRREAAIALGDSRDPRAAESLKYSFEHDPDDTVQSFTLDSLASMKYSGLADLLISNLDEEKYHPLCHVMINYLGKTRNPKAVEPLLKKIKDEDPQMRFVVIGALGNISDARAAGPLIDALKDKDPSNRWLAAQALGNIGNIRAVEPLIEALKDEEPYVRMYSATALGKIGDVRAIEPLRTLLNDPKPYIQEEALNSLKLLQERR